MTGRPAVAAWAGIGAGAGAVALAAALLHRTLTVALEIRRYADDIAATGEQIAANTDAAHEVARLRRAAADVRRLAAPGEAR